MIRAARDCTGPIGDLAAEAMARRCLVWTGSAGIGSLWLPALVSAANVG